LLGRHSGYLERFALYTVRKKDFTDSEINAEVIERLQEAARKRSRYGHCLRWDQIDLGSGRLHVHRAKGGVDTVHPLSGREIRALRQLRRENAESRYLFLTERGGPATTAGFLKTIARTGEAAKLPFPVHPHMLRHSTGYKLANDGHDTRALQHYMGHNHAHGSIHRNGA
jgi:site-specific recombinase XerC